MYHDCARASRVSYTMIQELFRTDSIVPDTSSIFYMTPCEVKMNHSLFIDTPCRGIRPHTLVNKLSSLFLNYQVLLIGYGPRPQLNNQTLNLASQACTL